MNRNLFIVLAVVMTLIGCRPRDILSPKQMEDIFVDLHTAEAILQEKGYIYNHDEEERAYFQILLEQHGTTQAQFDSSLIWYTANPTIFDKIYPKVVERLQTQLDNYLSRVKEVESRPKMTTQSWMNQCQYGLESPNWTKKHEKNVTKFAYVKKLL